MINIKEAIHAVMTLEIDAIRSDFFPLVRKLFCINFFFKRRKNIIITIKHRLSIKPIRISIESLNANQYPVLGFTVIELTKKSTSTQKINNLIKSKLTPKEYDIIGILNAFLIINFQEKFFLKKKL